MTNHLATTSMHEPHHKNLTTIPFYYLHYHYHLSLSLSHIFSLFPSHSLYLSLSLAGCVGASLLPASLSVYECVSLFLSLSLLPTLYISL